MWDKDDKIKPLKHRTLHLHDPLLYTQFQCYQKILQALNHKLPISSTLILFFPFLILYYLLAFCQDLPYYQINLANYEIMHNQLTNIKILMDLCLLTFIFTYDIIFYKYFIEFGIKLAFRWEVVKWLKLKN